MIEVKNLHLKYIREYYALFDINFKIEKGEHIAFLGKEGGGKTTMLRVLAKLEKFEKGEAYINDISVNKIDFKTDVSLGYIPTKPVFYDKKSVYENFKSVLAQRNKTPNEIEQTIDKAIIDFNLERYKYVDACDLSLYEKYVISLVRLTLRDLDIVLIDNIFKDITEDQQNNLIKMIKDLFVNSNITTIVATEDERIANELSSRIIKFENGSIIK